MRKALINKRSLSTNSLRKCMEISLENCMWILGLKELSNGTDYLTCLFDCCLCFAKSSSQLFDKKTNDCKFRYLNPGYSCLRNPESGKFSLVEYGILAFGIWNTAQRVDNPSNN